MRKNVSGYVFGIIVDKSKAKVAQELILNNTQIFKRISFIIEDIDIK